MQKFQDTFETRKWSFTSDFSIFMTVPLIWHFYFDVQDCYLLIYSYRRWISELNFYMTWIK